MGDGSARFLSEDVTTEMYQYLGGQGRRARCAIGLMEIASLSQVCRSTAAVCLFIAGCGKSGLELYPVHGRITLDGKPLADAGVMFLPGGNGPGAGGTTNCDGVFELVTVNAVGAIGGKRGYRVAQIRRRQAGGTTGAGWPSC